jgi:6-phosphogluconolactonase
MAFGDFRSIALVLGLAVASVIAPATAPAQGWKAKGAGTMWVYVGTYTQRGSQGIYLAHLDVATGRLESAGLAGKVVNPSFLAIHPSRRFLYAIGEVGQFAGGKGGAVSALAIDPGSGKLTLLNQRSSRGAGPCHVVVDRSGKFVLVANYSGGSVACLPIGADGTLGEATSFVQHQGSSVDPQRQEGPHAHSINLDAANRFAFVADLGLDKILIYRFDATRGLLAPNDPPWAKVAPGAGPRHFAFHPSGRYAYVINEMGSTVTAFGYDAGRGALETIGTVSTLPEGFSGSSTTAEVQVHPSGKFLYGSNRGHDSIAGFAIDSNTGRLSPIGRTPTQGKTPRNFGIDPTGRWLLAANQDSDSVIGFQIDAQTGRLSPTGQAIQVPMPVCVKFMPSPAAR